MWDFIFQAHYSYISFDRVIKKRFQTLFVILKFQTGVLNAEPRWCVQADVWLEEKNDNDRNNDSDNDGSDGTDGAGDVLQLCNFAVALHTKMAHIAKLNYA